MAAHPCRSFKVWSKETSSEQIEFTVRNILQRCIVSMLCTMTTDTSSHNQAVLCRYSGYLFFILLQFF